MSVYTKRKVNDLIIGQDNVLDLNTLSAEVKIYTNCVETYVTKLVAGGKVTLTADDIDYLNNGLISFTDGKFTSSTDYYIPNELNGCTDINAANISKLREKINNLGNGGDVDLSAVYGEINTLSERQDKLETDYTSLDQRLTFDENNIGTAIWYGYNNSDNISQLRENYYALENRINSCITQEEYDRRLAAGEINNDTIYFIK